MDILKRIIDLTKEKNATVVFAEGDEERTLEAAVRLAKDKVCRSIVVARDIGLIKETAKRKSLDISWIIMLAPSAELLDAGVYARFVGAKVLKGIPIEEAERLVLDPLYFSALLVESNKADAGVAGARSDTSDVIRAALSCVGTASGIKLISSFSL